MANLKSFDKHNMVAFLKKPNESVGFTEVSRFLKVTYLRIYRPLRYTITEASVRSKLQLEDATGIHNLSDAEIYAGLATLGKVFCPNFDQKAAFLQNEKGLAGDILFPLLPCYLWQCAAIGIRSYEAPLPEGNTSRNVEDNMQLKKLMDIVPRLVTRIETLETELQQTKTTYGKAVLTLVKRVKILEKALKRKTQKV
ncbi:hypothetical protein Tco_0771860 [Tanacetum coccineum]|uniref:Uncharacterized protein n=1 Tax=Tanacetum coccineum TaxID=301880 RepID=A0ABQ4ZGA8_9ASTR